MPSRGFFAFCTSLEPVELKAMGRLSRVKHLGEGEVIYSTGEPSVTLYIINRGVVEVLPDPALRGASSTYLWRGDIFGDLEALMESPYAHVVRTREQVSLQCIEASDFEEIARSVPSFFHYLSCHLAARLAAAHALDISKSHGMELSGNLENFDLVTIYQTISSSLQTGELSISDAGGHPLASFFFHEGQPRSGQFQHLTGTEAFRQLFLSDSLIGTFSFTSREEPHGARIRDSSIEHLRGNMLITALQSRDEFEALRNSLPESSQKLKRQKLNFIWPETADPDLRPLAEQIWQIAYTNPLPLSSLYGKCTVCEFKIYQAVDELVRAELFKFVPVEDVAAEEELVIESSPV